MFSQVQNISATARTVDLALIGKMLDTAEAIYDDPELAADPDMFTFAGRLVDSAQARYDAWLASQSWKSNV